MHYRRRLHVKSRKKLAEDTVTRISQTFNSWIEQVNINEEFRDNKQDIIFRSNINRS